MSQVRANCLNSDCFQLTQKKFTMGRNAEKLEWSLQATRSIPPSTFLGFYKGRFVERQEHDRPSLYAASVDSIVDVYPFADDNNISHAERYALPLASMNEPSVSERANCYMVVVDFAPNEVADANDLAKFYRGIACFTCIQIEEGQELTWHYGKSYDPMRVQQHYTAGQSCFDLEPDAHTTANHLDVLAAIGKVARNCVIPVWNRRSIRANLNKKTRKKSSDDDDDTSSSGSGHEQHYKPNSESRGDRLQHRKKRAFASGLDVS